MPLTRRAFLTAAAAVPVIAFAASRGNAQTARFYNNNGIAVDGSDVVAYFTEGRPVTGNAAHAATWMGVDWYFATEANRDSFAADPTAYAPQYGGYCAWAVAQGYTASTDPAAWRIVDGKLYLNFSPRIQRRWERDIPGNIAAGDRNWPGVLTA